MSELMPGAEDLVDWGTVRKSSWCASRECIEVAQGDGVIGFQDTAQEGMPDRSRLAVNAGTAALFFADVKNGAYDEL